MEDKETTLHGLTCLRCDHRWWPRSPQSPVRCPKCTSPYWNRERLRTKATVRQIRTKPASRKAARG
jgi:hypothetical protein